MQPPSEAVAPGSQPDDNAGSGGSSGKRPREEQPAEVEARPEKSTEFIVSRAGRRSKPTVVYRELDASSEDDIDELPKESWAPPWVTNITNFEYQSAEDVGLPVMHITEEEKDWLPPHANKSTYISVRCHVLSRFRVNPWHWLTEAECKKEIDPQYHGLVSAAYHFLLHSGYINFGVAPEIQDRLMANLSSKGKGTKGTVIVIGAGLAGLACARQLLMWGYKVIILEARKRPGGRVHTKTLWNKKTPVSAELGGSVLTGASGNPLTVLARQLTIPLHKIRDSCPLYRSDGTPLDSNLDTEMFNTFNSLLDAADRLRRSEEFGSVVNELSLGTTMETLIRNRFGADASGKVNLSKDQRALIDWHLANLEYANAAELVQLSLAQWDQDDPYELQGDHNLCPGGNFKLVYALADKLPILYGSHVAAVAYGASGVQVTDTNAKVFHGDAVVCTLPLGVLKRQEVTFEPELPARKQKAIERLGYGVLNKIILLFPYAFWSDSVDTFGYLGQDTTSRGEFFLFYSYSTVSGGALLIGLVAGTAAIEFEKLDPHQAINRVMSVLTTIFEPRGVKVVKPLKCVCTRWSGDPYARGSYSHVQVGAMGEDYDVLAEAVGERLFFAGEATWRKHPATMHGAFLSGMRAASQVSEALHPEAIRRDRLQVLAIAKGRNSGWEEDLSYTIAMRLAQVFKDPDEVHGCVSIIFHPTSEDEESATLVRVALKELFATAASDFNLGMGDMPFYFTLPRKVVRKLRGETADKEKLRYLISDAGVRFLGRRGLSVAGEEVLKLAMEKRKVPAGMGTKATGQLVKVENKESKPGFADDHDQLWSANATGNASMQDGALGILRLKQRIRNSLNAKLAP